MTCKKDFNTFIAKRCERALLENSEYLKLEKNPDATQEEIQALAETICYKQCFKDFIEFLKM